MDVLVWKKGVSNAHSICTGKGYKSLTIVTGSYASLVHTVQPLTDALKSPITITSPLLLLITQSRSE